MQEGGLLCGDWCYLLFVFALGLLLVDWLLLVCLEGEKQLLLPSFPHLLLYFANLLSKRIQILSFDLSKLPDPHAQLTCINV